MGVSSVGSANGGSAHIIYNNIELDSTEAIYFGDSETNGSWRIIRSGNDLVIQRLESGTWTTKSTISA